MKNFVFIFCLFGLLLTFGAITGCALPPKDISGQDFVPEEDLSALRYTSLGMQEVARGRLLQGEITLRKGQLFAPDSEKIKLNLGVSLYRQERYEEALGFFEPLHNADPLNPSYQLWRAKALIGAGALDEATSLLEKAEQDSRLQLDMVSAASFARTLANARYRLGDIDGAICASQNALTILPNAVEFLRHVKLLMHAGRLKSAEWFLKHGVNYGSGAASASSVEYPLRMGELEYLTNNIEAAKSSLQSVFARGAIADSTTAYEVKLLSLLVGEKLQALGESVDLAVLKDERAKQDLLEDPRRNASPLSLVLGTTSHTDDDPVE